MIEFCVQGSINPEALWVKPLLEQGRRWERCKPVLLLIREKYPVVKKRSRKLEMVSNLQLQKIALKVRRDGSQASIFVRTFRSFTKTVMLRPVSVANRCNCIFHSRLRAPFEPPPSATMKRALTSWIQAAPNAAPPPSDTLHGKLRGLVINAQHSRSRCCGPHRKSQTELLSRLRWSGNHRH